MASASLTYPTHARSAAEGSIAVPTTPPPEVLPASAQRVFTLLRERGALTHKDLLRESGLPGRTVRWAVTRLKEEGLVQSRYNLRDSRQSFYFPVPLGPLRP